MRKPHSRFICRIERLLRDVYRCVCSIYHELLYSMEASGILKPGNLCSSPFLLPRINKSLSEFMRTWNMHLIRTAKNWSPQQIMIHSMIREGNIQESLDVPAEEWGVDDDGPIPDE